jgi:uncharacterized protein (AIM24 family)
MASSVARSSEKHIDARTVVQINSHGTVPHIIVSLRKTDTVFFDPTHTVWTTGLASMERSTLGSWARWTYNAVAAAMGAEKIDAPPFPFARVSGDVGVMGEYEWTDSTPDDDSKDSGGGAMLQKRDTNQVIGRMCLCDPLVREIRPHELRFDDDVLYVRSKALLLATEGVKISPLETGANSDILTCRGPGTVYMGSRGRREAYKLKKSEILRVRPECAIAWQGDVSIVRVPLMQTTISTVLASQTVSGGGGQTWRTSGTALGFVGTGTVYVQNTPF